MLLLFVIQIVLLYFISRWSVKKLADVLRTFFAHDREVFLSLSLLYFPGTLLHEAAHLVAALALLLKVTSIKIFPQFEEGPDLPAGRQVKLGSVQYEKKGVVRSIVVGVAPIFAGLFFFWVLAAFRLFPGDTWWLNLLWGYLIWTVSTTMFSSRQDLVDLIWILPIAIIVAGAVFVLKIDVNLVVGNKAFIARVDEILKTINWYLFLSLMINIGLIGVLVLIQKLKK